jgi:amino acid transporter/nucleotide-binding universal stress UspA family protein
MLVTQKRPRDLHWYHAGPLLFGDWGTSRLYVLGLAFYYTGHASPIYLAAMSILMIVVAWAYSVICRCFPDGGGVYAAARQISPTLSVIGATLLLCDYIVTAALSAVEGFNYFGTPHGWVVALSIATILLIGIINWLGAKSAGRFALIIAIAAIALSLTIAIACIPMVIEGFGTIKSGHSTISSPLDRWENLVRVVLALSGLEAVANMTGLMKQPVAKTSRRTIFPVLCEVVILNMVFGLAINALPELKPVDMPHYVQYEKGGIDGTAPKLSSDQIPHEVKEYRDTAMRQLADEATYRLTSSRRAGQIAGIVSGIIFGLLLISAVNTAIMAMVSVKYAMSADAELPGSFKKLNYSGVPWIGLIVACILPGGLLLISSDAKFLAELYAIGVVGAIAINVICCAVNKQLPILRWERGAMWALGAFMTSVFITIVVAKPNAAIFAGIMVGAVLVARAGVRFRNRLKAESLPVAVPEHGWVEELKREPLPMDPSKPRIMLAARGRGQAEFAVDLARRRGATLFVMYVRTLRVLDMSPNTVPKVEDDPQALQSLGAVAALARKYRVPVVPIYICATDVAAEILDYTVTFACDTLIMGKTQRRAFARALEGDVITQVVQHLPSEVALITRDSSPHPMGPEPAPEVVKPAGQPPPPVPEDGND